MAKRAAASWSVVVKKTPDEVFDYLADVRHHADWSPKAYRIEGLAAGPVGKGTTFTSYGWIPRDADHRNDVEVTEYERPSRFVLTSREQGEEFYNRYTLTLVDGGTKVDRTMDMPTPPGFQGAIFPLVLGGFIKPAVGKGMKMFKANLEGSGAPS
jgi:uncharacterized protein YndB with AHSA1/START domain